jgi:hypothetical protein
MAIKKKHLTTLRKIKTRPVLGTIPWSDIESLFKSLGAVVQEREGSRVAIILNGRPHVFHRPHPSPDTDKGAVMSVKRLLMSEFPDIFDN